MSSFPSNKPKGFGFSGFSIGNKTEKKTASAIPPDPATGVSKHGYSTWSAISKNAIAASIGMPKERPKTEEEYFNDDDEDTGASGLAYIPAPGSPGAVADSQESDEDPLDAFMQNIQKQQIVVNQPAEKEDILKGVRDDIEGMDDEESYYKYMDENPNAGKVDEESDIELEYDDDGNPVVPVKSKHIDPLPPIDHSTITYNDFEKNFYEVHAEIESLSTEQVSELRTKLGIKVSGASPPKPVSSFAHLGFDDILMKAIRKSEFTQPTPIQAQGIPIVLSGRDIMGIAKTGSGKTAAFLWPMLVHICDQPPLKPGEGPIGLILAPTRELSLQIYNEAKKFGKIYNIHVVCCYGGGSKWEQSKALEEGAEIVVATPGRMIDLVKMKATNVQRVTYLVLDEADRMFDMGFEPQVRSICDHVRPTRQTLLFSATFKKKIEKLARDILVDPIKVVQGTLGEANEDVTQIVKLVQMGGGKWNWLTTHLVELNSSGSVLIFVTKKANAEELANNLKARDFSLGLLHGDMDQLERNKVISSFKKQEMSILVATDVAARGLDIPHIKTVVNFDVARDIDTHTHRVGRTGRAGEKGTAYTLLTSGDKEFAGHIVRNLEGAGQIVPEEILNLALQSNWFRKSRFKSGKGKKPNVGGRGLGFTEKSAKAADTYLSSFNYGSQEAATPAENSDFTSKPGPGSDRLSAMKAAFRAQYKSQFCAATPSIAPLSATSLGINPNRSNADRPRKKSRWD